MNYLERNFIFQRTLASIALASRSKTSETVWNRLFKEDRAMFTKDKPKNSNKRSMEEIIEKQLKPVQARLMIDILACDTYRDINVDGKKVCVVWTLDV